MPGFVAHYLLGVSAYQELKDDRLRRLIRSHSHAYALGLEGPDIFFYYLPGFRIWPNVGAVAHNNKTQEFLLTLLDCHRLFSRPKEQETAFAYAAGFIGHYTLDTVCHPYIYWKTHYNENTDNELKYFGKHVYLETDIDKELLYEKKLLLPSEFKQNRVVSLSSTERRVVARCLHAAYRKVFPEQKFTYADMYAATLFMPFGVSVLHDPHGKKKVLTRKAEKYLLGYAYVSPMVPSDTLTFTTDPLNEHHRQWKNPWDQSITSTDSFYDLYNHAAAIYLKRLALLAPLTDTSITDTAAADRQRDLLAAALGNLSYSSGLPL